jgi:hypothetical protein
MRGRHVPQRHQLDHRPVLWRLPRWNDDQRQRDLVHPVHCQLPVRRYDHGHDLRVLCCRLPESFRQHLLRQLCERGNGQPEQSEPMSVVRRGHPERCHRSVHGLSRRIQPDWRSVLWGLSKRVCDQRSCRHVDAVLALVCDGRGGDGDAVLPGLSDQSPVLAGDWRDHLLRRVSDGLYAGRYDRNYVCTMSLQLSKWSDCTQCDDLPGHMCRRHQPDQRPVLRRLRCGHVDQRCCVDGDAVHR